MSVKHLGKRPPGASLPTIFVKDSPHRPYKQDFRSDPPKWESVCASASGAGNKDKEEIRKNWNKKPHTWV